jgi:hypothetical protein
VASGGCRATSTPEYPLMLGVFLLKDYTAGVVVAIRR